MKKKTFEVVVGEKKLELAVVLPNNKQKNQAESVYNRAFKKAIDDKMFLRAKLKDIVIEQGLWDEEKQQQENEIRQKIAKLEYALQSGGKSLLDARKDALELLDLRNQLQNLRAELTALDNHSAEAKADNERFLYYVSVCTVYNDTGKPYFNSYAEFEEDETNVSLIASALLMELIYGFNPDSLKQLPERKFLSKYGFLNEKGQLTNRDGKLVNSNYELIDEEGFLVNEKGERTNEFGQKLDENGKLLVTEQKPFLDENGKPVLV